MLYTFGTGHGHLLALELFYRAGGMARVCPIMDDKLMLHVSAAGSTAEERKENWVNEPTTDSKAIEITSLREGTVPGTHTVTYLSDDDKIEIKHTLFSRRALALGAVVAAEFVAPRKGVFTIDDLFE
jgi:dihydrodipicolinate reductase